MKHSCAVCGRIAWDGGHAISPRECQAPYSSECQLLGVAKKAAHYIRYGNGQQQGTRYKADMNTPSVATERGDVMLELDAVLALFKELE